MTATVKIRKPKPILVAFLFTCAILPVICYSQQRQRISGITTPSPEDTLPACDAQAEAESDEKTRLRFKNEVKKPYILEYVDAAYSKEARKKHIKGASTIALTVTAEGLPTEMCSIKTIGYGLDEQAALAVRQYKFSPAIRDGKAVSVRIQIEIRFRLF